ncbi:MULTISPECIES: phosphatase PAP2 family protein [unclassified Thioalkalivibrio]|uniref:phosphatase PAP2 family protein n=1 Tax=unclassified Thioalkalivibrio TaxID=2621013 RepID=UPI00035CD681|nr:MULTISPECIES: phosphatase PAP2 family protein [unclassified Thioalkalivibrio]
MRLLQRVDHLDGRVARHCNRFARHPLVSRFFAVVSRLGNGGAWYAIMLALPAIHGIWAWTVSLHMMAVGLVSMPLYRVLKQGAGRPRPYRRHDDLLPGVPALDEFSFPSGHTMHAVGFTVVLVAWLPAWAWLVVPFALLVAMSRLVLALHYPSDVAVGALIGALIAGASLALVPWLPLPLPV